MEITETNVTLSMSVEEAIALRAAISALPQSTLPPKLLDLYRILNKVLDKS